MKLKFIHAVALGGGVDAHKGQVHDVPDRQAKSFIRQGKAIRVDELEPEPKGKK
jgi:hypothetical protein